MDRKAPAMGLLTLAVIFTVACGDDEDEPTDAGADTGAADGGGTGGKGGAGGGGRSGRSGGGGEDEAGTAGSGGMSGAAVARGEYLVTSVVGCGDCHTPRNPDGSFDQTRRMGGVDCFVDTEPGDPDVGCLSARNLTDHETGLKNRTDQEVKDMLLKGERPANTSGFPTVLHPFMPYWAYANMSDADADAIVAYLRTLAPVDHRTSPRQPPFDIDEPAPAFPEANIPVPRSDYADRAAAMRGRYLAGNVGTCLECHTPRDAMGGVIVDMPFQGGQVFPRDLLRLPPIFPAMIYTSNLTPDPTGIEGWSVSDIVTALKQGTDKEDTMLCPPMPSGPMGAFAGLTDDDARDIAHYLLSLPPASNVIPADCVAMPPPDDVDAGDDDAG
jgi:mono/diheme cytochrome c family protein